MLRAAVSEGGVDFGGKPMSTTPPVTVNRAIPLLDRFLPLQTQD
jgi:hypothetical protein